MAERVTPEIIRDQRFDGSSWTIYQYPGTTVVLTDSGKNLLANNPLIRPALAQYRQDVQAHGETVPLQRRWFKAGANSDVYSLGEHPVVVKESTLAQSAWFALDRMDYLFNACRVYMGSDVRVPEHYGLIISQDMERQYLFMQKANDGLTVQGVIESDQISAQLKSEVHGKFSNAKSLLDRAVARFQEDTGVERNLLPDWHEGNVIVDFSKSGEDTPFTLWVIDQ